MGELYEGGGRRGSGRARTHLSNERTFLAWFRTALALIALGLAAAQFLARGVEPGVPLVRSLAIALVASGAFAVAAGLWRYYRASRQIEANEYRPARHSVAVMAVLLLFVAALSAIFVLFLRRP